MKKYVSCFLFFFVLTAGCLLSLFFITAGMEAKDVSRPLRRKIQKKKKQKRCMLC